MRLISLVLVALLCVACIPFPHRVVLAPEFTGRVSASGAAVSGASVLWTNSHRDNPCSEASQVGKTTGEGTFRIEQRNQLQFFYAPLVVPIRITVYALCINAGGKLVLGYRGATTRGEPASMQLICDLDKPYLLRGGDGFRGQAICHPTTLDRKKSSRIPPPVVALWMEAP